MVALPDVLAVVNARAGTARRPEVDAAMSALRAAADGSDVELVATESLHHLADTLRELRARRLVILGGDGTVHAALQALHDDGALHAAEPIGIVPLGTGNDLARSLRLPTDPEAAARVALTGTPREMALLVADDGVVAANAVHVGIGAAAGTRAARLKPRLRKVGLNALAYPIGAIAAGATERGWRLQVTVDETVLHAGVEPLLMAAIGLGGTVGGGAPLVPDADPHDALIDVVVSQAVGPLARLAYARQVLTGSHVLRADVRRTRGRAVEITAAAGEAFPADIDGEVRGPFTSRRWEVEPRAWEAVVPA